MNKKIIWLSISNSLKKINDNLRTEMDYLRLVHLSKDGSHDTRFLLE